MDKYRPGGTLNSIPECQEHKENFEENVVLAKGDQRDDRENL